MKNNKDELMFTKQTFGLMIGVNVFCMVAGSGMSFFGDIYTGSIFVGVGIIGFTITTSVNYLAHVIVDSNTGSGEENEQ